MSILKGIIRRIYDTLNQIIQIMTPSLSITTELIIQVTKYQIEKPMKMVYNKFKTNLDQAWF